MHIKQQFDMQSYLTSCLNAHNYIMCTHLHPNRFYCPKDSIFHYLSRLLNTSTSCWCHGNHNYRLLWSFLPAKCYTASACNYPLEHIDILGYLGTAQLLQPKQNKVLSFNMEKLDFLPWSDPNLVLERDTYMAYWLLSQLVSHMLAKTLIQLDLYSALSQWILRNMVSVNVRWRKYVTSLMAPPSLATMLHGCMV